MKYLVALLVFSGVIATHDMAYAVDTIGVWSGDLHYTDSDGGDDTATVSTEVASDGIVYSISNDFYSEYFEFDIQGTDLYLDGSKVGEFSDSEMSAEFAYDGNSDCTVVLSFKLTSDTTASYLETYTCLDGYSDSLDGEVTRE